MVVVGRIVVMNLISFKNVSKCYMLYVSLGRLSQCRFSIRKNLLSYSSLFFSDFFAGGSQKGTAQMISEQ